MLVALTTHPIQYQAPVWRALGQRRKIPFHVLFMCDHGSRVSYDREFQKAFEWDIDLRDGYDHQFLAHDQDLGHFLTLRLGPFFSSKLRELGAEVLWLQGWQVLAYWQALLIARSMRIPVWMRAESNLRSGNEGWQGRMKRFLLTPALRSMDQLLYIGADNKCLFQAYGAAPGKLTFAPYGVDNERFARQSQISATRRNELRRAWNIPDRAFCFLFVGKFIGKKRPIDIIQALEIANRVPRDTPLHMLWVGSGELGNEMRRRVDIAYDADSNGVTDCDRTGSGASSFAGFLNQSALGDAYAAADCLILPSDRNETWGLVVNEAMASGLPCIVSDACGCAADLVKPFHPDLRYPVGNVDALARSMLEVSRYPPNVQDVQRVIAPYDFMATVEAVENLYLARTGATRSLVSAPL